MKPWESYIRDVQKGKRIAGQLEKLTVERFISLKKNDAYYFDTEEVENKLNIISKFRHTKGKFKGVPFNILPWQAFMWAWMFGLKHKSDGFRITREMLLCMAKKGGKSEVGGATGVVMTYFDGQPSAECYSAANSTDQALYSWNAGMTICKQLAAEDEGFRDCFKMYDSFNQHSLIDLSTDSFFKAISAETRTLDGVNPHFGLVDEFHEARNDSIPKNLKSGMVGLDQPLLMFVTTRGFVTRGELNKLEQKHIGLLRNRFKDDSAMSLIFALDPEDETKVRKYWGKPVDKIDKTFWSKSNPGIGIAPTWRGVEVMYTDAVNEGQTAQVNAMVKNLNMWVRQSKSWLDIKHWNRCSRNIDESKLSGKLAIGAYDLSTKWDLTAKGLLFFPQPGLDEFVFLCSYYCPEEGIKFRSERDKVPYKEWAAEGKLIATPGNVIDYDYIREDISEDHQKYEVWKWFYDPMFATETSTKLYEEEQIPVEAFKQTTFNYNEGIMKLEEIILAGTLNKGHDDILDWMFENVAINRNKTGLVMFDKDKSQEKIDGMAVLGMCMSGYLRYLIENPIIVDEIRFL